MTPALTTAPASVPMTGAPAPSVGASSQQPDGRESSFDDALGQAVTEVGPPREGDDLPTLAGVVVVPCVQGVLPQPGAGEHQMPVWLAAALAAQPPACEVAVSDTIVPDAPTDSAETAPETGPRVSPALTALALSQNAFVSAVSAQPAAPDADLAPAAAPGPSLATSAASATTSAPSTTGVSVAADPGEGVTLASQRAENTSLSPQRASPAAVPSTAPGAGEAASATMAVAHQAAPTIGSVSPLTAPAPNSAPTPAAAPPLPLTDQLVPRLGALRDLGAGEHVLTIAVTPEDLGPVRVVARITSDGVRIDLIGATDQSREALRGVLNDLRRDLAATGLNADLNLGSRANSGNDQSTQGRSHTADAPSRERSSSTPAEQDVAGDAVKARTPTHHGRLDLFV